MIAQRLREPASFKLPNGTEQIGNVGDYIIVTFPGDVEIFTTLAALAVKYPKLAQHAGWRLTIDDILDKADIDITTVTAAEVRQLVVNLARTLRNRGAFDTEIL